MSEKSTSSGLQFSLAAIDVGWDLSGLDVDGTWEKVGFFNTTEE